MKALGKPLLFLFILFFSACTPAPAKISSATPTTEPIPSATRTPFLPVAATTTPSAIPSATPTLVFPTFTPDPLLKYTISAMYTRSYGGGFFQVVEKLGENNSFTRYKIRYLSDGLKIYGFMNVPKGEGPFPVIIAIHGYSDPVHYQLLPYSTDAADQLSREGYLVIHPNMRGYGESDDGDDRYRAGLAIDILNLIATIKQPGALTEANTGRIGIWAHSMGGEIALRVLTLSRDIKATMLYAPMTGDIIKNAQIYYNFSGLPEFQEELNTPAHLVAAISPASHYQNFTSALKLYHGTADTVIPVSYGRETCAALTTLGKEINCAFYEGAKHTFNSTYSADFNKSFLYFFQSHLKEP